MRALSVRHTRPSTGLVKQLVFDFSAAQPPTFDNFVSGVNAELVARLLGIESVAPSERLLYIWGEQGSGRTHLLRATATRLVHKGLRVAYIACSEAGGLSDDVSAFDAILLDDVERLGDRAQVVFFNIYNAFRECNKTLVVSGNAPPTRLVLRADVVTRLAWGLVYEVRALTDEQKIQALSEHAAARGFALQPEVAQYLLTHLRRDMPALIAMLDALDRYSLSAKRAVTMPLVREVLSSLEE
jgi:DnaA family protein